MLGCVTPMTRCAAVLSGKPIFLSPFESRDEADRKKMSFANGKSDALTMLRAFQAWIDVKEQQGNRAATDFAKNSFLSLSGLETALQLADSYYKGLEEIGFAAPLRRGRGGGGGGNAAEAELRRLQDDQSEQSAVLSAVLTASLYPNVLAVDAPSDVYAKVANGAVPVEQDSKLFKFFQRSRDGNRERVFLHPRSVNFKTQSFESPWLVYLSMQQTDRTYVHDTAVAMPYPLMLFGRSLDTDLEKGIVVVDKVSAADSAASGCPAFGRDGRRHGVLIPCVCVCVCMCACFQWIHFRCPPRIAALVRALKLHLNATLEAKIGNPSLDIRASPVISAILRIITTNGF
jgi:HrpA-like RNA helicase